MNRKTLIRLTSAAALFPLAASAATITWNGLGDGTTFEDGSNWGGTAPADDLTTDIAEFTGPTVDLSTTRQVNGLDFSSGSTLSGIGSIEVGTGGITVGGNSTIGTTSLVMNNTTGITLNGTLDISSALVGSGDFTVTAGTATDITFSGDSGGDDTSSFTGNMTFDGVNVVASRHAFGGGQSGKTISLLNGSSLGANGAHLVLGARDIVISGGASLIHSRNRNIYRFTGVVSGDGGLTYGNDNPSGAGSGKIQLDGTNNTYTGGTTINTGASVWVEADGSLGAAGESLTIDDGTFYAKNSIYLNGRDVTIGAGGATIEGESGVRVTMNGLISGGGDLTIKSSIFRAQSSGNTLSGNVTIDGSRVEVRTGGAGFLGTGTLTLDNGAIIEGSGNNTNMGSTTNIVIGDGGGTFRNAHTKAFHNLGNATVEGTGVLTLDGGGSTAANNRIQIAGMNNTLTTGLVMQNLANVQVGGDSDLGAAGSKVTIDNARFVSTDGGNYGTREFEIASGGGTLSLDGATTTLSGPLTGTGALLIDGRQRDHGSTDIGGTLILNSTGTLSGGVTVDSVSVNASANNALGTGTITLDNGGQLKNRNSDTVIDNNIVIASGGGEFMAGWGKSLTLNGTISGAGALTIVDDSGTVIMNGANSLTGATSVEAGGSFGGDGSLAGDLTLAAGAFFIFSESDTLTVTGSVTLDSTFGADDLVGLSAATALGTYVLIDGTLTDFSHIENFGAGSAFDLGSGKSAYFRQGSLELVVVPEPGTFALLAGMLALGSVMIRRRRS